VVKAVFRRSFPSAPADTLSRSKNKQSGFARPALQTIRVYCRQQVLCGKRSVAAGLSCPDKLRFFAATLARSNLQFAKTELNMQLGKLRLLFEAGNLMATEILPTPLEPGPAPRWVCQFKRRNEATVTLVLNHKR